MDTLQLQPKKILIIKPSSLGDIIHSLPFLSRMKKCFPQAEIHWMVVRGLDSFLEGHPLIEKLWVINKDKWKDFLYLKNTAIELVELYRGLHREKFDLTVDLSGLLRSGFFTWLSGAKYRIGFADGGEGSPFFYSHKVFCDREIHAIDKYLHCAKFLGCQGDEIECPMAPFNELPEVCRSLPGRYAVMAPSAGKEANRWPAEKFGQLAAKLPIPTVVIASQADIVVANTVINCSQGKAISLAGKTNLKELLAVTKKAQYFISNDTGPMHFAAALQVPVFAIFGPANPARTGPYGSINTIIREDLPCSPCYAWKPCNNWQCMDNLTVEKVLKIIKSKTL